MKPYLLSFSHVYIQKITYMLFHARKGFEKQNFSMLKKQIKSFAVSIFRFAKEALL